MPRFKPPATIAEALAEIEKAKNKKTPNLAKIEKLEKALHKLESKSEPQQMGSNHLNQDAKPAAPRAQSAEDVRNLMAQELAKSKFDRFRAQSLTTLLESAEKSEARAETAAIPRLEAMIIERDVLLKKVAELQPKADSFQAALEELQAFKRVNLTAWNTEQVMQVTEDAARQLREAQYARTCAEQLLEERKKELTQPDLLEMLKALRNFLTARGINDADLFFTLPPAKPRFWSMLFGWSAAQAKWWSVYRQGYSEPSRDFLDKAVECLLRLEPTWDEEREPYEALQERAAYFKQQAGRWMVLTEIQRRVTAEHTAMWSAHSRERDAATDEANASVESHRAQAVFIAPVRPQYISSIPLSEHGALCECGICRPDLGRTVYTPRDVETIPSTPDPTEAWRAEHPQDEDYINAPCPSDQANLGDTEGDRIIRQEKARRKGEN
jgi:hypothetical protein